MEEKSQKMYNDYLQALTIFLCLHEQMVNSNLELPYGIKFGIEEGYKLVENFREYNGGVSRTASSTDLKSDGS